MPAALERRLIGHSRLTREGEHKEPPGRMGANGAIKLLHVGGRVLRDIIQVARVKVQSFGNQRKGATGSPCPRLVWQSLGPAAAGGLRL